MSQVSATQRFANQPNQSSPTAPADAHLAVDQQQDVRFALEQVRATYPRLEAIELLSWGQSVC